MSLLTICICKYKSFYNLKTWDSKCYSFIVLHERYAWFTIVLKPNAKKTVVVFDLLLRLLCPPCPQGKAFYVLNVFILNYTHFMFTVLSDRSEWRKSVLVTSTVHLAFTQQRIILQFMQLEWSLGHIWKENYDSLVLLCYGTIALCAFRDNVSLRDYHRQSKHKLSQSCWVGKVSSDLWEMSLSYSPYDIDRYCSFKGSTVLKVALLNAGSIYLISCGCFLKWLSRGLSLGIPSPTPLSLKWFFFFFWILIFQNVEGTVFCNFMNWVWFRDLFFYSSC